ncbi:hypothetical protein [Streptomyces sp. NBRC 110611]|uniref:hypothetical protein n=1 Tax=Streptomyces sp. NBRC 110611 TaxID=1621259 RepID=UPI000A663FF8|nr:hypothetical protein [Streptomyces sp. NBRC 110611]
MASCSSGWWLTGHKAVAAAAITVPSVRHAAPRRDRLVAAVVLAPSLSMSRWPLR